MAFRGFKDTLGNHLENKLSIGNGKNHSRINSDLDLPSMDF